ncbi:MAG: MATE family efflux transporter [Halodesulfurarchaeum sp.]
MLDVAPEDITEGRLIRSMLVLSAPLLVQNVVQVAQQVIDLFWLGRLSGEAVAAMGLVFPLVALVLAVGLFAPFVGTQVVVSQRVGGEERFAARQGLFSGLLLAGTLGTTVGLAVYMGARPLIALLTLTRPAPVAGQVPAMAASYLGIIALGLPLLALSDTTEAGFVGWGDSRAALYMNLIAVSVNATLDPVFIFGLGGVPALGISGAALATVVGYSTAFVFGLGLVARGRNDWMLSRAAASLHPGDLREVVDVGWPTAAQQAARQVVRVVIIVVVFTVGGPAGLAAYIVGARVASIAFVPATGLQQAAQSVVGQNLGAERPDRASRATWSGAGIAAATLGVVGVIQWLVPGTITTLLVPNIGAQAFDLSVLYLQILAIGYPAIGAAYLLEAGFNGARRTRVSFVATLLQFGAARLPIAAIGAIVLGFGMVAVFWAVTLSNLLAAVGLAAYYRYATATGMLERAAARATTE